MKITRKTAPPRLWTWLQGKLPPSMVAKEIGIGYGLFCGIYLQGRAPSVLARLFESSGDPIASISGNSVELHHPEYFSDFEMLLRRFERETGIEATLEYWESSKDEARTA